MVTSHLVLVYLRKHMHIKHNESNEYWEIIFYQIVVPFQYQVMRYIMIFKFLDKNIDFKNFS